jgi:hypothetical protein
MELVVDRRLAKQRILVSPYEWEADSDFVDAATNDDADVAHDGRVPAAQVVQIEQTCASKVRSHPPADTRVRPHANERVEGARLGTIDLEEDATVVDVVAADTS